MKNVVPSLVVSGSTYFAVRYIADCRKCAITAAIVAFVGMYVVLNHDWSNEL